MAKLHGTLMGTVATICPFLVPVVADRLWLVPVGAYCRSTSRVRIPAGATLARLCTTPAHRTCPGYRAVAVPAPVRADRPQT